MIAFVISRFGICLQMSILEEKDFPFLKNIPFFAKDNKIDLNVYCISRMPDNVDVLLIFLFQRSGTGQCFQMSLYYLFLTQIFW